MGTDTGNAKLRREIRAFLHAHHVTSLATIVGGQAHTASVMFAPADFSLYWMSDPGARHSVAIEGDPRVAATVAPDYEDFRTIRGLQITGRACRLIEAGEAAHARQLLRRRYPFLRELGALPAALRTSIDSAAYYRLDPAAITLIDNTRKFGDKRTLRIA